MELARESITWPDVEGKITSSKVISETSRDSKKRNSTTYSAHIEYYYIIADKLHTGDNVSFGDYGSGDWDQGWYMGNADNWSCINSCRDHNDVRYTKCYE
jgi:hypothetical protein